MDDGVVALTTWLCQVWLGRQEEIEMREHFPPTSHYATPHHTINCLLAIKSGRGKLFYDLSPVIASTI